MHNPWIQVIAAYRTALAAARAVQEDLGHVVVPFGPAYHRYMEQQEWVVTEVSRLKRRLLDAQRHHDQYEALRGDTQPAS